MTKEQLANKKALSAGLDLLVTGSDGRTVNALCIPDSRDLSVHESGSVHCYGSGLTTIVLTCRNDGAPKSIREALDLMITSLATAK